MTQKATALYRNRRFATYWTAQAVSELGDRVSELAIPLIAVTMLHATSTQVGLLTAAVWAPQVLSMLTGAWVDRRPRKKLLLMVSDLVQGLAVLTVPLAYWLGSVTLEQLVLVAVVAGVGRTLHQTAYSPFFVSLVRREKYVEANSLLSTTRAGSFVVGPALGGLLIQVLTGPLTMLVDAVSFFVSAGLTGRVRARETAPDLAADEGLRRRAPTGFRYLWAHPYLSASLRCCTTLNFFSLMAGALVVLYASRTLGLTAAAIGLAFGIGASGGLVGAILAPRLGRRIGIGHTIAVGAVLFSAPFALIPLASGSDAAKAVVLGGVEALSGAGIMLFDVNLNALQTAVIVDDMRSRVSGAFSSVNYGIRPVGALVGGVAGDLFGVGPTLVVAAVGASLSVLWLLRSPIISTRTIEELEPMPSSTQQC